VEKSGDVIHGEDECGDTVAERAASERRSSDILSVKKDAKLAANKVNELDKGNGDAELRCSSLLDGLPEMPEIFKKYFAF